MHRQHGAAEIDREEIIGGTIMRTVKRWSVKKVEQAIEDQGGFDNYARWNAREQVEWVIANFHCSKSLAERCVRRGLPKAQGEK
jgi:hypothetical protein